MNAVEVFASEGPLLEIIQKTDTVQVATITVPPESDAGPQDVNETADQVLLVLRGRARIKIVNEEKTFGPGTSIVIPAGSQHHIYNPGEKPLFLYSVILPGAL